MWPFEKFPSSIGDLPRITWYGHASIKITGTWQHMKFGKEVTMPLVIYIDPFELPQHQEAADFIFITHAHFDHYSPKDINPLLKKGTQIFVPEDLLEKSALQFNDPVQAVKPLDYYKDLGLIIQTVPAYNTVRDHHPAGNSWVGYILTVNGKRIYHAGDTDLIPEMKNLPEFRNLDYALLPVGGTYTMDALQAAEAAKIINPQVAVPIHWGKLVGLLKDAKAFRSLCRGKVHVEILQPETSL
ncbi:MBL fold metallo-hydrolase [Candidatus Woesearchaeota archaeon]|nr:MBL fold metallo-hydrolase [Candidatus Woesearchaeota archaeon]